MNTEDILGKIKESDSSKIKIADTNPYQAMAATFACGLYGIKNKLKLDIQETIGKGYSNKDLGILPKNLLAATGKMAGSAITKQLFGEAFVDYFTKTREWEWRQFASDVTDCEFKRYFEII